ncbi:3'-5' exoribonuclease [Chromobacterium sp. S0633]|uniref:3'-5' exonuclease n=1 Tax=Chromobacterium sp. S0633 TaxID=2957805 RepID=UPI0020A04949|nr:3'-5' exonuclease [Chromobacterium sp. S0633]MCP1290907.1 3'-5' exoribonuclease [Chromobacterium sp. S0633]
MKTRQIIIDNETLDIAPSAVLLTIGAVAVEIENGKATPLARWYRRLQWDTGHRQPGRTVSQSTVDWWLEQSDEAFSEAFEDDGQRLPIWLAMHSLQTWLQLNPYPIWGNGSDFDNAQLQHAFTQHGLRWPFWRNRCLRSQRGLVLDLYPETKLPEFPADKIKHHALHDAEHEADVLAALLRTLTLSSIACITLDIPGQQLSEPGMQALIESLRHVKNTTEGVLA